MSMRGCFLGIMLVITMAMRAQISFAPYQHFTTGSWPSVVAVGDIDHDGLNDVALGLKYYFDPANDYHIFIYTQNPSGGLNAPVKYAYAKSGAGISSIAMADLNSDGLNDLAIGFDDTLGIYFQNTSGTLDPLVKYKSGASVDGVKAGDLNNDGKTDLVVSHWNDSYIRVFYQQTPGTFTNQLYPKQMCGYDEIDIGDVNNDGLNDVVFMGGQGSGIHGLYVFHQNSAGTLSPYIYYNPSIFQNLGAMAIGDVNNDGLNDICATVDANRPEAAIMIWYQGANGSLLSPVSFPAYDCGEALEISDLDCDGKNEIIAAHGGWEALSVHTQDSMNSYKTFNNIYGGHYEPEGLSIGDINNDGKKDAVVAGSDGLAIHYNNSKPVSLSNIMLVSSSADTIYTHTQVTSSFTYYDYHTDTVNQWIINHSDGYHVDGSTRTDSIKIDSVFVGSGYICGTLEHDTILTVAYQVDSVILKPDTEHIYSMTDTVGRVPDPPPPPSASVPFSMKIGPSPTPDVLTISCTEPITEVRLYNTLGQLLFDHAFSDKIISIDCTMFARGEYELMVVTWSGTKRKQKILIAR